LGRRALPDRDIIVFGPRKSTEAPHRPDEEKSDTRALIDRGGTRNTIASRTHPCSGVQRSIFVKPTIRCRQFDHNVVSRFEDRISRQRPTILL
jgi:hypothetical protein